MAGIYEASQVVGSGANLTMNVVGVSPELQGFLDKYNLIVAGWGLTRFTTSAVKWSNVLEPVGGGSSIERITVSEAKDFLEKYHQLDIPNNSTLSVAHKTQLKKMKDYLVKEVDEVVGEMGRFVANSGTELKTYLDDLVTLPAGKPYSGKLYRYKTTGSSYNVTDINPNMNPLENRFKTGLYASTTKEGNLLEVNTYGGTSGKTQYEITNVQMNNLLDLTDERIIEQLGTSFEQMKLSGVSNKYEYTHVMADWAKSKGYSGVRFYGAQSSGLVYENIIVFEQSTVNNAIINSSINSIQW